MNRRNLGLSLAEVMIGATLLLLVTGLAFKALQIATRYTRRVEAQQALTEKSFEVIYRMEKEIEESQIDLMLLDTPRSALTFLLPRNEERQLTTVPESGDLVWSLAVSYRLEDGQILRKQSPVVEPSARPLNPLGLGFDSDFFSAVSVQRVLARGCTLFEFNYTDRLGNVGTTDDGTALNYLAPAPVTGEPEPLDDPAVIDIRLKLEEKGDRTYAVTIQSTIYPKN